ncbi:MAG: MBL fold metallo-hydrolase [Clostridiales bacterium]|jgi:glyoxylase-like metal-dependent hydrolase (beta-lactamase superfamily II)|nr:MBL fold metallo-hydrolase [Clostridiales bacterium]
MQLMTIPVGPIQSNAYIYYNETTKEAIMIDCGDEAEKLLAVLEQNKLTLKAILLTHSHFDHISAVATVSAQTGAPVYAGANELPLLAIEAATGRKTNVSPETAFANGDFFDCAGCRLKVLFTPGHTAGSVCYYDEAAGIIFTGDTLFYLCVGRVDLPTGSWQQMLASFKDVLYTLPKETVVYPGHDQKTTIGFEMTHNQDLRAEL